MFKSIFAAAVLMVAGALSAQAGINTAINDAPAAAKTQQVGSGAAAQGVKVRVRFGGHRKHFKKRIRFHKPVRVHHRRGFCRHWLRKFHHTGKRKFLHRYKRCVRRARFH